MQTNSKKYLNDSPKKDYVNWSACKYEMKIKFDDKLKRSYLPDDYDNLISLIRNLFDFNPLFMFSLEYLDDEGDFITLSCENDFKYLKNYIMSENINPIKINLIINNVNNDSNLTDIKKNESTPIIELDSDGSEGNCESCHYSQESQNSARIKPKLKTKKYTAIRSSHPSRRNKKIKTFEDMNFNLWFEVSKSLSKKNHKTKENCCYVITYEGKNKIKVQFRKVINGKKNCQGKVFKITYDKKWDFDTCSKKLTNFLNYAKNHFEVNQSFHGLAADVNLNKF